MACVWSDCSNTFCLCAGVSSAAFVTVCNPTAQLVEYLSASPRPQVQDLSLLLHLHVGWNEHVLCPSTALSYQTRLHANGARMPPSALVIASECGTRTVTQVAVGAPHPRVSCDQWHVWCTERYMKISYIDRDTMHHAPPLFALRTCSGLFQSTPLVFTSKQTVLPSSMHVSPKRFQRSSRQL